MKLTVLGSSSLGNCYLLHNERECLIIEAGIKFLEVKKALNFKISQIVGLLVSHEHGDHAAFLHEFRFVHLKELYLVEILEQII